MHPGPQRGKVQHWSGLLLQGVARVRAELTAASILRSAPAAAVLTGSDQRSAFTRRRRQQQRQQQEGRGYQHDPSATTATPLGGTGVFRQGSSRGKVAPHNGDGGDDG